MPTIVNDNAAISEERWKSIDESLLMLWNICELAKKQRPSNGKRVDISYVLLMELPEQSARVEAAIQVSEALGHRVEVEIDRGEDGGVGRPDAIGLQFFTYVEEKAAA